MSDLTFYNFVRSTARLFSTLALDAQVFGTRNLPPSGGALIVSNHQSYLDPALLASHVQRPLSFFAKSELFENKYFGGLIRALHAFPVRQGEGDVGAVREAIRRLKEGNALVLFPEGSRTMTGALEPIQPGVALIVRRAGVPVVPAVIEGTYDAWPRFRKLPRRFPVRVAYGPPMQLAHLKAAEIVATIDRRMHELMADLHRRLPRPTAAYRLMHDPAAQHQE